ncbi:MAG TPA: amino acid adenylation domain-containing protein [Herpetosiphonaceae bacterium]
MNTDQVLSSVAPVSAHSLLDLLQLRTRDQPERTAYIFLQDGEHTETRLTYAELDRRARSIAALLQRTAAPGERVLLLYPPGLDYLAAFFGCLYAGLVAVPAYPPHPQRPMPRLQTIVADAGATHALTTGVLLSQLEQRFAQLPDLARLRWLSTDGALDDLANEWQPPAIDGATLAFVQYTSGSTATPKGVMLTHANLLHNLALIQRGFGHTPASRGVIWLPPYHDMGLIGGILQPLYAGFPVTLMSPLAFLQRPLRWLEAITRYGATTSGGPNFAYDLCVRKVTPEQRATLDLRSWDLAFCGAEPVRAATLARFAEAFGPCGFRYEAFYPCYGLAEATLIVSGGARHAPPIIQAVDAAALERDRVAAAAEASSRALVGCGQPLPDQQVRIVDLDTLRPCPSDRVGEIWVAGLSVAQGYWNQPAATEQTFGAHLAESGAGPFLRTGDLGFLHDGELFITGRIKDLIIIRGRNHYPQDIEQTVEASHRLLRPASGAAFGVEVGDDEQLVIVQEVERQGLRADLSEVIAAIRQAVAEQHEVPIYAVVLLKPATIPKTTSGKIQRHACRAAFRDGTLDPVAAWHASQQPAAADERDDPQRSPTFDDPAELQSWLAAHLARSCGVAPDQIALDQPITRYGLDSMAAIELLHGIETQTGAVLSIAALLQGPSIAELAAAIAAQRTADLLPAVDRGDTEQLSYGQRALWFLHQLAPQSTAYTVANAVQIDAPLDAAALQRAADMLIDRHPLLRAAFPARHGEPFQQVGAQQAAAFVHEDATAWDAAFLQQRLVEMVRQPFDLERGPLLRIALFTQDERRYTLLLAAHHSVTDFWSQALLLQELDVLYAAALAQQPPALPPLTARYGEYVAWQQVILFGAEGARLWEYWRRQLADAPTVLNLPTDRPRPPVQTFHGAAHSFTLDRDLTSAIRRFTDAHGLTLYMTLLAAFEILLHRYTGQDDLLVGSPMAGRSRAQFAHVVGYFVNPVALRIRFSDDLTCAALLRQVRQTALAAFEHQDFPFPLLVERLQPDRDPSRPPLVQAMFALQQAPPHGHERLAALALGIDGIEVALHTLPLRSVALPQQTAQFELALVVAEVDGALRGSWQYNTDLFDAATIERMARHWERVLRALLSDPAQRAATLPLLTEAELGQLLGELAGTAGDYPADRTLHELIEVQAEHVPETIAVVWQDQRLSYAELNRRANQLAHHLRALGVGADTCVGLCVERSPDAVIGILGILKAGGAYVPLDPAYPAERLAWMLEHSGIGVLLTQAALLQGIGLQSQTTRAVCLDRDWPTIAQGSEQNPPPNTSAAHAAYVLHTSGSTGRPKGVCCDHGSVVNVLHDVQRRQPLAAGMACSWWASLSVDVSVLEIFSALLAGGTLHIVPQEARFDGAAFARWLHRHQVRSAYIPAFMLPDLIAALDGGVAPPLHRVVVGVEPIQEQLLARIMRGIPGLKIINGYGPTETTICTTLHSVDPRTARDDITPLGTPVQNTRVYLLDAQMQPVPVGVLGEIYIGGAGLARGYVNQPDRTAERFLPDPFAQQSGGRLYRTGDLARYLADGTLMFAGRRDHQIKLRGYRIELDEIEQTLMQHPAIQEAIVTVQEVAAGDRRLVAYVVAQRRGAPCGCPCPEGTRPGIQSKEQAEEENKRTSEQGGSEREPRTASREPWSLELRTYLKGRLPAYMVPSAFVVLDALPLLPSGKVDRKALPLPDEAARSTAGYLAPQTEIERMIAAIWQETLHVERVGLHDNFFEIGGHSLLVAQVQTKLREAFDTHLSIVDLFQYPTIYLLAERLQQQRVAPPTFQQSREQAHSRKAAMQHQARRRRPQRSHEHEE